MPLEHDNCLHEQDWGKLWEIMRANTNHCVEGDKEGGFRDRLLKVEIKVDELKNKFWQSALIGGVIGALIGSGSSDVIRLIINWLINR